MHPIDCASMYLLGPPAPRAGWVVPLGTSPGPAAARARAAYQLVLFGRRPPHSSHIRRFALLLSPSANKSCSSRSETERPVVCAEGTTEAPN
eukprot:4865385-Prymnesium_polylepis.2